MSFFPGYKSYILVMCNDYKAGLQVENEIH